MVEKTRRDSSKYSSRASRANAFNALLMTHGRQQALSGSGHSSLFPDLRSKSTPRTHLVSYNCADDMARVDAMDFCILSIQILGRLSC
jgi:hypothetical protein